jgi:hypothetical protein
MQNLIKINFHKKIVENHVNKRQCDRPTYHSQTAHFENMLQ